nr:hypothetical protein [Tanacetum cinerariifolium]
PPLLSSKSGAAPAIIPATCRQPRHHPASSPPPSSPYPSPAAAAILTAEAPLLLPHLHQTPRHHPTPAAITSANINATRHHLHHHLHYRCHTTPTILTVAHPPPQPPHPRRHLHKDYALESATRILNMVPTKKGCEALVKWDTPDKLQQRSVKCIFIGYPKKTMGYYFYFPAENKIVVASEIPMKVEGFEPPQEEVILIRRSERALRAPNRLCLNVKVDEHSLEDLNEPASYKVAMLYSKSNKGIDAMNAEIQSMIDNVVWVLIDLPPGCKTVESKWIFKKKTDMDGIIHTYKARLVAKGYTQLYEVDYEETFSPVVDIRAIRILISIAAKVCKLQRSIYGLKKASRSWNKKFDEEIKRFGFAQNLDELCVYQKASISNLTFLILYVDDIIIIGNHISSLRSVKDKILERYKMDNSKRGHISMQEKLDLNKTQDASTPREVKRMQNIPFASAVGSIMYATVVKNILKYLRNTKDMYLVYGGNPEAELRVDCYCDAGFETDRDDTKSQTRYVFILNGGAVDWKSFKQRTTAMSVIEAEYIAASKAVWIRTFISGLGIVSTINEPIRMFCDNSAKIHFANEPGVQRGARHYHRRYHYVRESIALSEIRFLKVYTNDNLADPFMKALSKGNLTQHARSMGLRLASSFM